MPRYSASLRLKTQIFSMPHWLSFQKTYHYQIRQPHFQQSIAGVRSILKLFFNTLPNQFGFRLGLSICEPVIIVNSQCTNELFFGMKEAFEKFWQVGVVSKLAAVDISLKSTHISLTEVSEDRHRVLSPYFYWSRSPPGINSISPFDFSLHLW